MKTALSSSIFESGCASSVRTNCGRKARKKMESLGFRMLMRIADTITCAAGRGLASPVSIVSAPRSFRVVHAI
jgi:hypothetical protein